MSPFSLDLISLLLRLPATRERHERGSVTLEQVAIAAGLLVIALAALAVIARVVVSYTDKLG
jgi:hypothetical protein